MLVQDHIRQYLRYLKVLGRSPYTIKNARYGLRAFITFMAKETPPTLDNLTREILYEYQQELAFRISSRGKLLSLRTQGQRLGVILEILYDTAIRRSELAGIKINNLDLHAGFIHVHGKGDKDRVVPVSDRVSRLIENYIVMVRPGYIQGKDTGHLVLNRWGEQMDPNAIWAVVKRCADLAGIRKNVSTHTFRHTCATHMLKNGAPVRHIQEMLGHESLESTQVYTRVTINDLKEIHAKYHPGEKKGNTSTH